MYCEEDGSGSTEIDWPDDCPHSSVSIGVIIIIQEQTIAVGAQLVLFLVFRAPGAVTVAMMDVRELHVRRQGPRRSY